MALNWLKNWLLDRANSNFAQLTTHSDTRSVGVLLDHAEPELQDSILRYFEKKGVPNDQVILLFFFSQKLINKTISFIESLNSELKIDKKIIDWKFI